MTKKHLTTCDNAKSDLQSLSRSSSAEDGCPELVDTFMTELNGLSEDVVVVESQGTPDHDHIKLLTNGNASFTEQLTRAQEFDPELIPLLHSALDATKSSKVPTCFYKRNGILMRKWIPYTAPVADQPPKCCASVFSHQCAEFSS